MGVVGGDTRAVAELASVFDDDDDGQPRGPDLRVSVEVPRAALGATLRAPVPARIAADGDLVERVVLDGEDLDTIELHLPEQLPARAMLRLRGQGGALEGGRAGDLLVLVELVDRPARDDELITRSASGSRSDSGSMPVEGNDITLWLLLGLALVGGGVLVVLAL